MNLSLASERFSASDRMMYMHARSEHPLGRMELADELGCGCREVVYG